VETSKLLSKVDLAASSKSDFVAGLGVTGCSDVESSWSSSLFVSL
jgi:hypothetical protein